MNNNQDETPERVFLKPGEYCFCVRPSVVSTVLGSCVSVTMFAPGRRIGAICHAVLPEERGGGEPFRYVDSSILAMIRKFERHGIPRAALEVKLFGGSDVLSPRCGRTLGITVGKQNMETALRVVEKEGLRLVTADLGGTRGRKIEFHTHTGEIFLKRLRKVTRLQDDE
jgi:chemotaxis protein CheD